MVNKFNLEIKDCGPINYANVEINKINVVGGVNGSGKSTVSKALYSFLKANTESRNKVILNEIISGINEIINLSKNPKLYIPPFIRKILTVHHDPPTLSIIHLSNPDNPHTPAFYSINDQLWDLLGFKDDRSFLYKENDYINLNQIDSDLHYENFTVDDNLSEIIKEYKIAINIVKNYVWGPNDFDIKECIEKRFDRELFFVSENNSDNILKEFEDIYTNKNYLLSKEIFKNKKCLIRAYEEDIEYREYFESNLFKIDCLVNLLDENYESYGYPFFVYQYLCGEQLENGVLKFYEDSFEYVIDYSKYSFINYPYFYSKGSFNKITDVLFIDNISILDDDTPFGTLWHSEEFKDAISPKNYSQYPNDEKIISIINKINKMIGGKFSSDVTLDYKKFPIKKIEVTDENFARENGKTIELTDASGVNISSGYKQLANLYLLLLNNKLKENSFLIIDEPEVHLHPEWQIKFAEILVLLAKELDITLYLNSHSPMFIEAISLYSQYYDLIDETNFYLTVKQKNDKYNFKKIDSKDMGEVYENLTKPYDELDKLRAKILFKE